MLVIILFGLLNPALSTGPDALQFNPAQLAYPERPGFSCRLLDLGLRVGNNSLSFAQYDRYTGAYLDDDAKNDIFSSIPRAGFNLRAQGSAAAVEFGWKNFAASVRTVGSGQLTLPREVFDLALFGNELGRTYQVEDAGAFGHVYLKAGAAVATALGRNVAVGAGAHYLRGLAYAELREAEAYLVTTPDVLASDGILAYRKATGGSGFAVDLGVAYWTDGWRFTLACLDISPGITWTDGVEEGVYAFSLDSGNAYDIRTQGLFVHSYQCQPGPEFVTFLPLRVNFAVGKAFARWFNCGVMFQGRSGVESYPGLGWRTAGIVELQPWPWLPLGLEASYGQPDGPSLGAGAGLILGQVVITTRLNYFSGVFQEAKGVQLGFDISYAQLYHKSELYPFLLHHGVE